MRRLGIDAWPLVPEESGGIVPWIEGVIHRLSVLCEDIEIVLFYRGSTPPLAIAGDQVELVQLGDGGLEFYGELSTSLARRQIDVLLRTYPQEPTPLPADPCLPDFPMERQIFAIPDLQHDFFPQFFPTPTLASRRRAFNLALSRAGAIATLTADSRRTLRESRWNRCEDIFLMPAALPDELLEWDSSSPPFSRDNVLGEARGCCDRYFYMPANLWPHKNHRRLFEALREALPNLEPRTGLLLTGNPDHWNEVVAGYEDLPIFHLGYVPRHRMQALFRGALALTYFSLFEGFGIPLLEAFSFGVPVVCSNIPSLMEVAGDAVMACDPTDTHAIASLLVMVSERADKRAEAVSRGYRRLAEFTWDTGAGALRAAIERVVSNAPVRRIESYISGHSWRPKVTIIIGRSTEDPHSGIAAASVRVQTYPDVEVVIGREEPRDSAPSDHSCRQASAEDVQSILGENESYRHAAAAAADSEILGWLPADTILLPRAVGRIVDYFASNPEWDMIFCSATGPLDTIVFWRPRVAKLVGDLPGDDGQSLATYLLSALQVGAIAGRTGEILGFISRDSLAKHGSRSEGEARKQAISVSIPGGLADANQTTHLDDVARLEEQLRASESDRAARLEAIEYLQSQLSQIEADRLAQRELIRSLEMRLAESEADRAAKYQAIARVEAQLRLSSSGRSAWLQAIDYLKAEFLEIESGRSSDVHPTRDPETQTGRG
jgi:glycosyltransferase involved in cell wall biosynthesis